MQGIAIRVMAEPGKYSVQQLQQAVQSGSLPAYIGIPLIQEKLKQQKQMQGMEQARSPEGPSIAEQVMQEAQGAQGVQALPTNLPQQYAGGGIVAFDEGGEVERYQNTGLVAPVAGVPSYLQWMYSGQSPVERERQARLEAEARARAETNPSFGSAVPVSAPPVRIPDEGTGILGGVVDASGAARAAITGGARAPAADTAAKPAAGGPAKSDGITGLKFTPPGGTSYEQAAQKFFSDYAVTARNADVEAEAKKAEARGKLTGQAFEDYKKSLEEEAKQAGAERGQAKNMALFKAGLAMMAGTSRHALENIGKGALLGAEDYQAAVKDLRKAEKERRREFAHIEQARRAEAIGDRDTAIREIEAARDRSEARTRYIGEGIYKATGMDKAQAFEVAKLQFASESDLAKAHVAGRYQLEAAKQRAAMGAGRGAFTQAQLAKLRMDAMERVDQNQIRNQVAKQLNFSKVPKPGESADFDARVAAAYDQAVNAIVNSAMGVGVPGGGGNPYQGFRIVPEE